MVTVICIQEALGLDISADTHRVYGVRIAQA